jgi:putative solute:sodium symporter small subunit
MSEMTDEQVKEYWKRNVSLMIKLLVVWFVVSFGCGIILVDVLNNISLGGYKLGFWFAQQGSIYVFVGLIFYYTRKMAALDREFGVDED